MSRRPAAITQADIARALRAAGQCGYPAEVLVLPGGVISIRPLTGTAAVPAGAPQAQEAPPVDDNEPIVL